MIKDSEETTLLFYQQDLTKGHSVILRSKDDKSLVPTHSQNDEKKKLNVEQKDDNLYAT